MGDYATLAEVRATNGLADETTFPDEVVEEAISYAEELIDAYTGTSWVYKPFSVVLSGNCSRKIQLKNDQGYVILFPRTISSATEDGVAISDTSGWAIYPEGIIIRDDAAFSNSSVGRNVVISGTAGATSSAPADIAWCARTLARQYALDLVSRVPDRAMQIQNDFGTVQLSQASNHPERPTSLPEVNARLARRRHISDSSF